MGVKGDNLEINSGLLLSSFILNYMTIRVKEKGLNKKNRKNRERREKRAREREERRRKQRFWGDSLFDRDSSVEVGYGLCYFIVKLLIANDMYWVVLYSILYA